MLVLGFGIRRSDHAFFFGCRFFLFELCPLGIFRVFFAFVFLSVVVAVIAVLFVFLVQAGLSGFRARVGSSKHAILRIARRVVILSVGNMLR